MTYSVNTDGTSKDDISPRFYKNKCLLAQALDWVYSARRGHIENPKNFRNLGYQWSLPRNPLGDKYVKTSVQELHKALHDGDIEAYGYTYFEKPQVHVEDVGHILDHLDSEGQARLDETKKEIDLLFEEVMPNPDIRPVIIPSREWEWKRIDWRYNRIYTKPRFSQFEEGCDFTDDDGETLESSKNPARYRWILVNKDQLLKQFPPEGRDQTAKGGRKPKYDWDQVFIKMARALYEQEQNITKNNAKEILEEIAIDEIQIQCDDNQLKVPTEDTYAKKKAQKLVKDIYYLLPDG